MRSLLLVFCLLAAGAEAATPSNRAPTISGTLSNSQVGADYYFMPKASDPDGDTLTFSISGAPGWMRFRASDGRIVGQPDTEGIFSNIVISVRDSHGNTASLPPATITITGSAARAGAGVQRSLAKGTGTATLTWAAPTQNDNGTSLANLAGYRISYGTSETALTENIELPNPAASGYVVSNLAPGTYYFSVRSYNSQGKESAPSPVVKKVVK
ncbi:putative Ig domain-containing protein [Peristeroidobacter soli]|uniref:putative Ig domain-containing protein n=1 Tax=Peristeroidobacter soli TaxID=2497877 RepID=UPI00101C1BAE|nr:putative Ig domain-containing protein [Peristeroidobacter soli]